MSNLPRAVAAVALLAGATAAWQASANDGRRARFDVHPASRIEGVTLPASPTTANCETRCQSHGDCVGYSLSRTGICELYRTVTGRRHEPGWRSGYRATGRE